MASVSVTVTNSQNSATPAPFQQLVVVNLSSIVSSYSDLLNLQVTVDGSQVYAYIENTNSNFTQVIVWVLLPNGIPAGGSVTITFANVGTNQYPYTGISPLIAQAMSISPTQYDNGGKVFSYYQSFAGLSALPSGWQLIYNSGSPTFGTYYLVIPATGSNSGITSANSYGGSGVTLDVIANLTNVVGDTRQYVIGLGQATTPGTGAIGGGGGLVNPSPGVNFGASTSTSDTNMMGLYYYDSSPLTQVNVSSNTVHVFTIMQTNNEIYWQVDYGSPYSYSASSITEPITVAQQQLTGDIYLYAVRTRATPPNGVMPSLSTSTTSTITTSTEGSYSSTPTITTPTSTEASYFIKSIVTSSPTSTEASYIVNLSSLIPSTSTMASYIQKLAPSITTSTEANYFIEIKITPIHITIPEFSKFFSIIQANYIVFDISPSINTSITIPKNVEIQATYQPVVKVNFLKKSVTKISTELEVLAGIVSLPLLYFSTKKIINWIKKRKEDEKK